VEGGGLQHFFRGASAPKGAGGKENNTKIFLISEWKIRRKNTSLIAIWMKRGKTEDPGFEEKKTTTKARQADYQRSEYGGEIGGQGMGKTKNFRKEKNSWNVKEGTKRGTKNKDQKGQARKKNL